MSKLEIGSSFGDYFLETELGIALAGQRSLADLGLDDAILVNVEDETMIILDELDTHDSPFPI